MVIPAFISWPTLTSGKPFITPPVCCWPETSAREVWSPQSLAPVRQDPRVCEEHHVLGPGAAGFICQDRSGRTWACSFRAGGLFLCHVFVGQFTWFILIKPKNSWCIDTVNSKRSFLQTQPRRNCFATRHQGERVMRTQCSDLCYSELQAGIIYPPGQEETLAEDAMWWKWKEVAETQICPKGKTGLECSSAQWTNIWKYMKRDLIRSWHPGRGHIVLSFVNRSSVAQSSEPLWLT